MKKNPIIKRPSLKPVNVNGYVWYYENSKSISFYINDSNGLELSFKVPLKKLLKNVTFTKTK